MRDLLFKIAITISFCFFLSSKLLGQEINKEYIIKQVEQLNLLPSTAQQQDSLEALTLKLMRINSDTVLPYFTTLDSLVSEDELKIAFYFEWAATLSRKGKPELSKKLRKQGLKMARKTSNTGYEFDFLNSLASIYVSLSKADSVAYYNILADKLIKKHPEMFANDQWQIHYRYAMMNELLGNKQEQKKELENSWSTLNRVENHPRKGFLIYVLLDFYRQTNDVVKQARFTELFIQHYNKKKLVTPDYHFPIETILLKDDSQESLDNLIRINHLSDSLGNLNSLSQTTTTLGNRLIDIGRANEAIPYLKNSIEKLKAAKYPLTNSKDLELLQKAYHMSGDYKNAYIVLRQQKAMEDSIRSVELMSTIADYEIKYETEKKDAELLKLNFEAEKAMQQERIYTIALISGGLILTILTFFYYRNNKQNIKLAKQKVLLEATVDEKNILLRETHHRVKNSFQMVSSLLFIQSETAQDVEAKNAIKEAQNRVRSMVLIHQKLYSKDKLVGIDSKEYIEDFTKDVIESHQFEATKLNFIVDAQSLLLDIETITPLGLILNELITNVLKHAFHPVSKDSLLYISFKKEVETLVLTVTDNGKGMPNKVKESSFGLQLIEGLCKKLKAELALSPASPKGTEAKVTMKRYEIL